MLDYRVCVSISMGNTTICKQGRCGMRWLSWYSTRHSNDRSGVRLPAGPFFFQLKCFFLLFYEVIVTISFINVLSVITSPVACWFLCVNSDKWIPDKPTRFVTGYGSTCGTIMCFLINIIYDSASDDFPSQSITSHFPRHIWTILASQTRTNLL